MKKIVIKHIPNTLNYGSAMMAENMMHYLNSVLGDNVEFSCDFSSEEDQRRMNDATKLRRISTDKAIEGVPSGKNKVERLINTIKGIKKTTREYGKQKVDGIIILGGDDLSEYYAGWKIVLELYRLKKLSRALKVFLAGQTIGPFTSWRVLAARRCLKHCNIYTRDPLTVDYLTKELRLRNVLESRDLAWLDLPRQSEEDISRKTLNRFGLNDIDYLTLVPSGIVRQYCDDRNSYIGDWLDIIKKLTESDSFADKKIVLLGHVVKPGPSDDRAVIRSIVEKLDEGTKRKVVPVLDVMLPVEARHILGNGLFTITGRMHAAVSTFQMGKPAISLSYSIKYKGVIGEGLGMNDLVIEAKGDDLWKSGKIVDLVLDKVDYVLANYESLVERIKPAVEENKKLAMAQIEDIARRLREKPSR